MLAGFSDIFASGYDTFSLKINVRDQKASTVFDNDIYIDTSVVASMRY